MTAGRCYTGFEMFLTAGVVAWRTHCQCGLQCLFLKGRVDGMVSGCSHILPLASASSHTESHSRSKTVSHFISSSVDWHRRHDGELVPGVEIGLEKYLISKNVNTLPRMNPTSFCILHWLPRFMLVFSLHGRQCVEWHQSLD